MRFIYARSEMAPEMVNSINKAQFRAIIRDNLTVIGYIAFNIAIAPAFWANPDDVADAVQAVCRSI